MQGQEQQTPEARAFLERIVALPKGPGVSLDEALQPSLDDEADLRKLFATDKGNARLQNPYVGLVDVFGAPVDIRTTRARVVKDEEDWSAKYVLPLTEKQRRKEGTPCMAENFEEFKKNWAIFTEGSLSQLIDWNNVVAAGGSVHACLSPLTDEEKASKRSIRKHYHGVAYPTSDVDLFLWGLTQEQAEKKINSIYEAVRDSVPWDVTCVRTKHTVSIHCQYPYRSIQVVLRLYSSPSEILTGFDVDAPCFAYDGQRVWGNPRAIVSMMRQCNTIDVTRRSPSYEVRLTKYSRRDLEVYVPSLRRADIDPTIYERAINRIEGLARLLVLEKLSDTDARYNFLDSRRTLRGRPNALNRYSRSLNQRKHKGDLKADLSIGGLEWNDYDVVSLHIPYGPGWDSRRIEKLVYQTDLGMNSTFNPKNKKRRLHRHVAFFGAMDECIEDCCEHCPDTVSDEERDLQEEEDKQYVRGRISFIQDDPGRQSLSGSFNPIDVGEWSEQVYIGPNAKFFAAIAAHDVSAVKSIIAAGQDLHRRDHVGRSCLHVAILCGAEEVAFELIDAGARMTARLVDGRSSLHLAAQYDQRNVIKKLLEKSAVNDEQAKEAEEKKKQEAEAKKNKKKKDEDAMDEDGDDADEEAEEHNSSDDDWDSDGEAKKKGDEEKEPENSGDIPDDALDEPDVLDVNVPDWDFAFTPLCYAVLSGSLEIVETLVTAGADPKFVPVVANGRPIYHPLLVTSLRDDKTQITKIVERLLLGGASSSTSENGKTIFYRSVASNNLDVVAALLKSDPNASTVIDYPQATHWQIVFPINEAIVRYNYAMVALLLAHGAKPYYSDEWVVQQNVGTNGYGGAFQAIPPERAVQPLEAAFATQSDVVSLLLALGASVNIGIKEAHSGEGSRRTYLDWANFYIASVTSAIDNMKKTLDEDLETEGGKTPKDEQVDEGETLLPWEVYREKQMKKILATTTQGHSKNPYILENHRKNIQAKQWYTEVKKVLSLQDAKSWDDVFPDQKSTARNIPAAVDTRRQKRLRNRGPGGTSGYVYMSSYGYSHNGPSSVEGPAYDELFEACFNGDNEKVQKLCLPESGDGQQPLKALRVTVEVAHPENQYMKTGITPLTAAIANKKWATAKLIMAIAMAQYKKRDEEETFKLSDYTENDSDSEDEDSMDTDEPDLRINFVDVAKRSSAVQCDVAPKQLLVGKKYNFACEDNGPLSRAIYDDDFEAFINVGALYTVLPTAIEFEDIHLEAALNKDQPEMLDQLIRWSGVGLDDTAVPEPEEKPAEAVAEKKALYLGLNVHGKKRADLATKKDPHSSGDTSKVIHPLVWRAARSSAKKIIEYLASDRPLAAYKFYASTHSNDIAQRLKYTQNLEKVLPEWLGWTISPLGESPLTAAILGRNMDTIKLLFATMPKLMGSTLHTKIKFIGYNTLLLAADWNDESKLEIPEFLLGQSISAVEVDSVRGWNIYHICCAKNHVALFDLLLKKLPKDVSEALLNHQSKKRLNTPLHLAVKTGSIGCVKLIVEFTQANLLTRNVIGSIPLHLAVSCGFPKITKLLVKFSPTEALYTENAVGEVPLAMIKLASVQSKINQRDHQIHNVELQTYQVTQPRETCSVRKIEKEAPKLRATVQALLQDGKLRQGTKLAQELQAFADFVESRIPKIKAADAEAKAIQERHGITKVEKTGPDNAKDACDLSATLSIIQEAITANPGKRQLVHLIDVQTSVHGDLPNSKKRQVDMVEALRNRRRGQELEEEEEVEGAGERAKGMVFSVVSVTADTY
ncbi:ankyrin [Pluteus cervinus]|uniref:Ankyrin n=1 Tax=Pluteus cervinus TaxID=181527 RepID=A0ACD3APL8_9AGAR|nr:ankyrin [Pluteus cervinus]